MNDFTTFDDIGVPGAKLVLEMGKLPKNVFYDKKGERVIQLCFTHGVVSPEEMAFHMKDILTPENFTRIQRNEIVEQIIMMQGKRYRIRASLLPMALFIYPLGK